MKQDIQLDRQVSSQKNFNYGLALLRMLMCFEVILRHFWTAEVPRYLLPFVIISVYAVPVFMFMSFYLTQKSFFKRDKHYAFNRIRKLLLPQIVWTVVYFVIYWIVELVSHRKLINGFSDFLWQLFTGHSPNLNATMWFQTNLIAISVLFFIIFYHCKDTIGIILIISLSVCCLVLQYSGLNYFLFGSMRYELKYPLGRLIETFPMATAGLLASRFHLLKPTKEKGNLCIAVFLIALFLFLDQKFLLISNSFSYAGIWKIGVALGMIMFALNLNFSKVNANILTGIQYITQNTLGIYCGHRLIQFFLVRSLSILFGIERGQFYQCILIYILGFILCRIIDLLPFKWIKSVV